MRPSTLLLFFVLVLTNGVSARCEVDESPLPVHVEPAFPNLEWPDQLTGLSEGRPREVRPLIITGAGDGTNRIFVATQHGTVHVWQNDRQVSQMGTFLDMQDQVAPFEKYNEEGFLGLAFHPNFAENREFYIYYTALPTPEKPNLSRISRMKASAENPNRADPSTEEVLMEIEQPYWNHNGGTILFGPDGYLYVGLGDGGSANDPHNNGQNLQTLLGSILRIDVNKRGEKLPYAIPPDNPFVGHPGIARGEIWAYGIRNIWRMSFDRKTGICWAADVGQNLWEEIDIVEKGENYGWNLREGKHLFTPGGEPREGLVEPIWEYHHDIGKSITGGNVYRGSSVPELEGAYLYADYVSGAMWALWYDFQKEQVTANRPIIVPPKAVTSFGEDDQGEVYYTTQDGGIYRFVSGDPE